MIIPTNAQTTTKAKIIFAVFLRLHKAIKVATIITRIVQEISEIPRIPRPKCTSTAEAFAIVATEIRHKYILKGTCTKYLSHKLPNLCPRCTLCATTINITKKASMMTIDKRTC